MKKFVLTLFAAFAGTALFAMTPADFETFKMYEQSQEFKEMQGALYGAVSKHIKEQDDKNPKISGNAVVNIKAVFDSETKYKYDYRDILDHPLYMKLPLEKAPQTGTLTQKCSGAFVSGGIAVLPVNCVTNSNSNRNYERHLRQDVKVKISETTQYKLKSILIEFNSGPALNISGKTATSMVYPSGKYAFITTGQKDKFENLPKLGVFEGGYNLKQLLSEGTKDKFPQSFMSFKVIDNNSAKAGGLFYKGPVFYEDTLLGVMNKSKIFYGIYKNKVPKEVLTALGDDNIKVLSKPK